MIDGKVSAAEAVRQLAFLCDAVDLQLRRSFYYPYFTFRARVEVPTLIGKQTRHLHCLVDAVNGRGATADAFVTVSRAIPLRDRLVPAIEKADAKDIAQRTVTHHLGKALRMIASFDVVLENEAIVWKRFWVVGNEVFSMLVDSSNAAMYPLCERVA